MKNFRNLMVDLEVLSLDPNAHISAIAAVWFDGATGDLGDELFVIVDPEETNGVIDASTVTWWMGQSAQARADVFLPPHEVVRLPGALRCLNNFVLNYWERQHIVTPTVWKRGNMDQTWLESAFKRKGFECEIGFRWWKDQRTIVDLANLQLEWPEGFTRHNPLDDCKVQIRDLVEAAKALGLNLR